jgi:ankyrin repeat protein
VCNGHQDVAALLVASHALVNATDQSGWTPLHYTSLGYRNVAELLLAHGAEVNARNRFGATPLHLAQENRRQDVAELLREHGGHE